MKLPRLRLAQVNPTILAGGVFMGAMGVSLFLDGWLKGIGWLQSPEGISHQILRAFLFAILSLVLGWIVGCEKAHTQALQAKADEAERLRRDLERARDRALAAVRTKSEFLAVMSHEIRTPMNSVLGFSELLLETPLDREQQEFVMMIRSNGRMLLELIEEILDFSKMEAGKYRLTYAPFGLIAALDEARQRVEALAYQKRLSMRMEVGDGVPEMVLGDEFSLLKIVGNLLGNAIKFTDRGAVVMTVERCSPPQGVGSDERAWVRLTVSDTGIGIPEEDRGILFEPFVQANRSAKRHYGGTGLGLAICRRLATQMGGRIWLAPESDSGATFHVELPFRTVDLDRPPEDADETQPKGDFAKHHPLRILVVEQRGADQRLLDSWLRHLGYDPELASDRGEAIECLQRQAWDLALVDPASAKLGGSSGFQGLPSTGADEGLPFMVAVAARDDDGDDDFLVRHGFHHRLVKPVRRMALLEALRRAHEWHRKRGTGRADESDRVR